MEIESITPGVGFYTGRSDLHATRDASSTTLKHYTKAVAMDLALTMSAHVLTYQRE